MEIKLLIAEDSLFMRGIFKDIVSQKGYLVVGEAHNGRQAIEMYKEAFPDLVVMDTTMPEMDGIEGTRAIRSIDPRARIIMCCAMWQHSLVIDAIHAGARDFIVKPFKEDKLLHVLERVMAR